MNELVIAIFGILAVFVILQTLYVLAFISSMNLPSSKIIKDELLPKAAVILSLRGADPFLTDCIRALLQQIYPQYNLHIVVDSQQDPAWNIVNKTIQQAGATHVQVNPLIARHNTCSLKGSALVQAIDALDDSYQVVAFIDADVIAHPNWLRELVAPLMDERIGATTGNRWYMPQTGQWGSLVRYLWNAVAVVFMCIHQAPWGGSMAMRLSVLQRSRLLEIWKQSVSVDVPIYKALQAMDLNVKFVPTLMMPNREECNLARCLHFITRQLFVTRLYNPQWLLIVAQVFTSTLAVLLTIALLLIALINDNMGTAIGIAVGFACYILAMVVQLVLVEQAVGRVIRARGESMTRFSALMMAKTLVAIPLTQLVYAVTVVSAILMRKVEWRGIMYQIKGPWNIRLIEYRPYQLSSQSVGSNVSL
ncbi:glycosyl transferase family 2 [Fischerella thermalis CCMEE 5201]|jgi:cellulose synthase/poly-beta-1,6-N-acetylglucosamine synthase-like glycosyltransferase|nr:glycosyl transferase family 2 [Fischerella thermalis CCMEE 5201]